MRHLIFTLGLLLPLLSFAQEDIKYTEYSYSQLFQMIEEEKDSVFSLKDAVIRPDVLKDSLHFTVMKQIILGYESSGPIYPNWPERDSLVIDKELKLNNVQFISHDFIKEAGQNEFIQSGLFKISFRKAVEMTNSFSCLIHQSTFHKGLKITSNISNELLNAFEPFKLSTNGQVEYENSEFIFNGNTILKSIDINQLFDERKSQYTFILRNSTFPKLENHSSWTIQNHSFEIEENNFENLYFSSFGGSGQIKKCVFKRISSLQYFQPKTVTIEDNVFEEFVLFQSVPNAEASYIDWSQWIGKFIPFSHFAFNPDGFDMSNLEKSSQEIIYGKAAISQYQDSIRSANKTAYNNLRKELAQFYNGYKLNHDTENANLVYVEMKNLETQRLAYLYNTDPSFDRFFTWKINQFLQIFSAYGTRPSRAIIFSVYVILAFALVYLFFPNYWDSHGKNRIMDRYRFFLKYVNKDSGMHEVYLDEKQPELLASEDFKIYLQEQGKTAPKFFMATALPLYRWSVAGTKTFSWMLSKVDVLKGKWSDTEDSKKSGKSILLIGAFLIALLYDIFIKVLNALMLSINTFTTLGFGEIPIKGLPRYLAIIQGFIGWFMLTIFSVSLISQLLN